MSQKSIVQVRNLSVQYHGHVEAVHDVSFDVFAGETLGIVGESGCGKSTLAAALVGDIPGGAVTAGSVVLHGPNGDDQGTMDLVTASEVELRTVWGRRVAMVYQDPRAALNPAYCIGDQIDEAVQQRPELVTTTVRDRTLELLERVRMPTPPQVAERYVHQLSGGQQQRAVIAMALAANPDLLILDEPTSNLDVTTEAQILDLVLELKQSVNAGIVFISHNLAVIAQVADRVGVMYAGELFEIGQVRDVFHHPSAPYTAGLLACIPRISAQELDGRRHRKGKLRLRTIPGSVPSPTERPTGCSFAPRCPFAREQCREQRPDLYRTAESGHLARCLFIDTVRSASWPHDRERAARTTTPEDTQQPILVGKQLTHVYGRNTRRYGFFGPISPNAVQAITDVSFELMPGETLGVVGESGCGKTTLVNCISGLVRATSGSLVLMGEGLALDVGDRPRTALRRMQMVFQNPDLSLNPQHTIAEIMDRAVQVLSGNGSREERTQRVVSLLERVGLGEHYFSRHPAELSGGEKQRVAVARALAGNPDVVLADEVTSALDVSVRAAILNLLNDLQAQEEIAYVFVSHDMSAIRYLSDSVMVLYLGMIMEIGPVEDVFGPPYHPYTEALISAIPSPEPDVKSTRIRLQGSVPGASRRPSGCPFHTRCPRKIGRICETETPPWREAGSQHYIFCHIPLDQLDEIGKATIASIQKKVPS
jgi:peptide/nickel transport system ATP-binding protein